MALQRICDSGNSTWYRIYTAPQIQVDAPPIQIDAPSVDMPPMQLDVPAVQVDVPQVQDEVLPAPAQLISRTSVLPEAPLAPTASMLPEAPLAPAAPILPDAPILPETPVVPVDEASSSLVPREVVTSGGQADLVQYAQLKAYYARLDPGYVPISEAEPAATSQVTATADVRKFSDYIFAPGADHGKDVVFTSLGYSGDDSELLASMYGQQGSDAFTNGQYTLGKLDQHGQRVNIEITLPGQGTAAGNTSYLRSGWMIQSDGSIKLNKPFSGFTR